MKREPVEILCRYPGTKLGERRVFRGIGREFFEFWQGLASRMDLDIEWSREWHRRISKLWDQGGYERVERLVLRIIGCLSFVADFQDSKRWSS